MQVMQLLNKQYNVMEVVAAGLKVCLILAVQGPCVPSITTATSTPTLPSKYCIWHVVCGKPELLQ